MPRLLVTDASIWIDLERTQLTARALRLPFEYVAPDLILGELGVEERDRLLAMGVCEEQLSGEEVLQIIELAGQYREPGIEDLSVLVLARRLHAVALTGDAGLRRAAEAEGLEVHGMLWLLDQMVASGVMRPGAAAEALAEMVAKGSRLPTSTCAAYQRKWRRAERSTSG